MPPRKRDISQISQEKGAKSRKELPDTSSFDYSNPEISIEEKLIHACKTQDYDILSKLISQNQVVARKIITTGFQKENTLLHILVGNAKSITSFPSEKIDATKRMIDILLENGAKINAPNHYDNTPLHVACHGSAIPEIAEYLLNKGADINAVNKGNNTPLLIACSYSSYHTIRMLLEHGTDLAITNNSGKNFFSYEHFVKCFLAKGKTAQPLQDSHYSALSTTSKATKKAKIGRKEEHKEDDNVSLKSSDITSHAEEEGYLNFLNFSPISSPNDSTTGIIISYQGDAEPLSPFPHTSILNWWYDDLSPEFA